MTSYIDSSAGYDLRERQSIEAFKSRTALRRFHNNVPSVHGDECAEWLGSKPNGYGVVYIETKGKATILLAHRVAFYLSYGVDPVQFDVLHKCDNKSCVRPDHLELGNNAKNTSDASRRGLLRCKISDDQVRKIRELYASGEYGMRALGRMFGVRHFAISKIVNGKDRRYVI